MPAMQRRTRSVERIRAACDGADDSRVLRLEVLRELRGAIGFDAYAWPLTDPQTAVGSAPLADVPCLPELPRLIRLKYLTTVNRWTTMTGGRAALLGEATGGDLARSLLWRELLSRYDIGDVASLVFRDRFGCWAFLDLWRAGRSSRFSADEAELLGLVIEPVTVGLRRCQARTFSARAAAGGRRGPVVLLLAPDLTVRAQTAATEEYLRAIVPPEQDRAPIPATAYNVAAQLLAVEAGVDANDPSTRLHLGRGAWVTMRAARLGDRPATTGAGPAGPRDIAVTIEESTPVERMTSFARAFGLTARETELLGRLCAGTDTRDVARLMHLSEHTVQDHLKSVFAKTGTRSRPSLLSRALGT